VSDGTPATIGIVELVDVCGRLASRNRALFRRVGGWVADENDPGLQRWFAIGSHRHAWHAELWEERLPKIPVDRVDDDPVDPASDERAGAYRQQLEQMLSDLDALGLRLVPVLDPSTARVISLVRADVADLLDRSPT
jgi:hypothetical protein